MGNTMAKRLQKELEKKVPHLGKKGFHAGPADPSDIYKWDAIIPGRPGTPWEGGVFKLRLVYPQNYPFKPPTVQFETPLYHPNWNEDGEVCIDILKKDWSPAFMIDRILSELESLMAEPQPEHSLRPEIGEEFTKNHSVWAEKARATTQKMAQMNASLQADID